MAGSPASLVRLVDAARAGQVIELPVMPPADTVHWCEELLSRGADVAVPVAERPLLAVALAGRGALAVVLKGEPPGRLVEALFRARDIVVAIAVLAVASPLLAVAAAGILRSSPGPVLYTTTVVGRHGRQFTWRKLRTMRVAPDGDAAERRTRFADHVRGGQVGKVVDASRVTPIGRWLRRHSIDELPQLLNVLSGDMTLVGPRPCLPYEYELAQPWQQLRYRVTPGLTGPWQAYGRGQASYEDMALLDYCYAHSRSVMGDLRILWRTAAVVLTGAGGL